MKILKHTHIYSFYLWLLLVFTFIIRFAGLHYIHSSDPQKLLLGDSATYINPARSLLYLGKFSHSPETPEIIETFRTPGYPLFLALIFRFSGNSIYAVIIIQIVISVLTIYLIFRIAELLFSPFVGIAAALFFALEHTMFYFSLIVLTETLFTFLITMSFFLAYTFSLKKSRKYSVF